MESWDKTTLYRRLSRLKSIEAREMKRVLESHLPGVETLLSKGGTTPTDFTLHDEDHAFRVAELTAELMPKGVMEKLSPYEISLLLMSAYLHDIGMVPTQSRISSIYLYLLTGEVSAISIAEKYDLNAWLTSWSKSFQVKLTRSQTVSSMFAKNCALAAAHYIRWRHPQLGDEWIRTHLGDIKIDAYPYFLDDLRQLCISHHQGYEELSSRPFDPKQIGTGAQVVHLRYLAVLLRVADILDFDAERTPDIVFRHREIEPASIPYWYKDHSLGRKIEPNRISISAEPSDAKTHRAIEQMFSDIEKELLMARRLQDEHPFSSARFQEKPLYHRWTILPDLRKDIRPHSNAYEYIEGGFRPNTERLLSLLSGTELYREELVAVRELVQNAFDAVREHIAWERVGATSKHVDPMDMASHHSVDLTVEKRGSEYWLVCTDSGIGMNKRIIKDHLLVSGGPARSELDVLRQRCSAMGFPFERTGKFGIGLLSYFMIAEEIEIRTIRGSVAGDADGDGWRFCTDGIGDFGELSKDRTWLRGSQVALRLNAKLCDDIHTWTAKLEKYLHNLLRVCPCTFRFSPHVEAKAILQYGPGWTGEGMTGISRDSESLISILGEDLAEVHHYPAVPKRMAAKLDQAKLALKDIGDVINRAIKWEIREGVLPDSLGRYRFHLPHFEIVGGVSPIYMQVENIDGSLRLHPLGKGHGFHFWPFQVISYMGIKLERPNTFTIDQRSYRQQWPDLNNACVEIDFTSEECGTVSVDRFSMLFSDKALKAVLWLQDQINNANDLFWKANKTSPYYSLAAMYRLCQWEEDDTFYWSFASSGSCGSNPTLDWLPINYPFTAREFLRHLKSSERLVTHNGLQIRVCETINVIYSAHSNQELNLATRPGAPDRVLLDSDKKIVPLWDRLPKSLVRDYNDIQVSQMPPEWNNLIGMNIAVSDYDTLSVLNASGPLLHSWKANQADEKLELGQGNFLDSITVVQNSNEPRAAAAEWFIRFVKLSINLEMAWETIRERHPEFVEFLWLKVLGLPSLHSEVIYIHSLSELVWTVITGESLEEKQDGDVAGLTILDLLKEPSPEWTLKRTE